MSGIEASKGAARSPGALYDRIGAGYDRTRRPDPRIVSRLASRLAPLPGGRYLDVACGTGSYTCAMAERGGGWSGLDASRRMVTEAGRRSDTIAWQQGRAEQLPYADARFDGVLCTLAVHHFSSLDRAFGEVRRVLRGDRFVLFSCTVERTLRYWLNDYFPAMFRRMGAKEPSEDTLLNALRGAGFTQIEVESFDVPPDLEDLFLYCGKHRPELYFDPAVRDGISSFANLCEPNEVEEGLARLRADLDAGRPPVPDPGTDHPGDYALIVASGR